MHLLNHFAPLVTRLNPASGGVEYLFQMLWGRADAWNDVTHATAGELLVSEAELPGLFGGAGMYPELVKNDDNSISVPAPLGRNLANEKLAPGQTGTRFDDLREGLKRETGVLEERWTELLTFGGWIDVGPPGAIPHG